MTTYASKLWKPIVGLGTPLAVMFVASALSLFVGWILFDDGGTSDPMLSAEQIKEEALSAYRFRYCLRYDHSSEHDPENVRVQYLGNDYWMVDGFDYSVDQKRRWYVVVCDPRSIVACFVGSECIYLDKHYGLDDVARIVAGTPGEYRRYLRRLNEYWDRVEREEAARQQRLAEELDAVR